MISFYRSRFLPLLYVFATINLLLTDHARAKFFSADLGWTGLLESGDEPHPTLTDLLAFRDLGQDPVFEKAMHVVDNLATQSSCHRAAAAHLLVTCKAVGSELAEEPGKHELLERAKSVYAVRVAVCETGEGRAAVPLTCKPVLNIPQRLTREIDVVSGKALGLCLEALMNEHYYWTSYSNNRQDANTLCQASTLEATRLEALHSYQKLAELIPDFGDALMTTRDQWLSFAKQQEQDAQAVHKLQERNRDEFEEQHRVEVGAFRNAMTAAKQGLENIFQDLQQAMADTGTEINRNHDALGNVLEDFSRLEDLLRETVSATSKNAAEMLAAQAKDMSNIHDIALATTEALNLAQADQVMQDISGLFHRVKSQLDRIAATQSTQLQTAEHHLRLNEELSEAQKASLALGREMHDSSVFLAGELDSANAVASRVSMRLDKVNQALTRVEKASSLLSTLSALIAIPFQLVEHLHLRLLGLLTMPAILVSFWKPRIYSYSLVAIYVFLESFISLFAEHRDTISTCLLRLSHHSRSISGWPLRVLGNSAALVGLAMILLGCYILFALFASQLKPNVATVSKKPACGIMDKSISNRYYLEQRLRNGKRLRHDDDRFRRAATVC